MRRMKYVFLMTIGLGLLLLGCRQMQGNTGGQSQSHSLDEYVNTEHDGQLLFSRGEWKCINEEEFKMLKNERPVLEIEEKVKGTINKEDVTITVKSAQQSFAWEQEIPLSAVYQGDDGGTFKQAQEILVQPHFLTDSTEQTQEAIKTAFGYEACYTASQLPTSVVFDGDKAVRLMFVPKMVRVSCLVEYINGHTEEVIVDWPLHDSRVANGIYYAKGGI